MGFVIFDSIADTQSRKGLVVGDVKVRIVGSLDEGNLVTTKRVEEWVKKGEIKSVGLPLSEVNLEALEREIIKNGFIDNVKCYLNYQGELCVDVWQRRPVVRLMVDGYNTYITAEGLALR